KVQPPTPTRIGPILLVGVSISSAQKGEQARSSAHSVRPADLSRLREVCMDPVGKALWFIESHYADDISLESIAAISGVTRYHLSPAFGYATGHSIMRYVRARRLSEAARTLVDGAPDILTVALDAGYGSHEAFTRAFRDQFGLTPETIRSQGHLDAI